MIRLSKAGAWLIGGRTVIEEGEETAAKLSQALGCVPEKEEGREETIAYRILRAHDTSEDPKQMRIRFDSLTSHDITYVGIIQTARASGLTEFPMPYVLTNCHNSLCAVGGTINEDDHVFGLSAAKKYGGIYVPPHQAVIHQFAREMLAGCGRMVLGSDSHTRYGALGTLAVGEGGPELVKQLLGRTWDIAAPQVVAVYLTGEPVRGVGPQDVALAIIGAVFESGYVNNKILEFVGPGVEKLSADFRIGVDVMTTETTCLSSVWQTDGVTEAFLALHGRADAYAPLAPGQAAYYDGMVCVDLSAVRPMIAMPFHPSNVYTIEEVCAHPADVLAAVEEKAAASLGGRASLELLKKVRDGRLWTDQGVIAGCAGGGFENLCAAADILRGREIGTGAFALSVYPASQPILMELVKNGRIADLIAAGATVRTAFCGPCFGAGDVPANHGFSVRHSTRNFPNREGSKIQSGQIASVALMDARSIAATAAAHGALTPATALDTEFTGPVYHFDSSLYEKRVYFGAGRPRPEEELVMGPNIKDWPEQVPLTQDVMIRIVSEIHDPVTTTDELIPSGETSSYRSNPLGLAEFTLSRRDPEYVGRAKAVQRAEAARREGACMGEAMPELRDAFHAVKAAFPELRAHDTGIGSAVYAVRPGDGSAREQAASCQRVLGGLANVAAGYATKRYRSNLINWGMLPLVCDTDHEALPFGLGDFLFLPGIRAAVESGAETVTAYVASRGMTPVELKLGALTPDERKILLAGCLINFYKGL
ncbi:MAG: hydratase [Lachnospiraceae bacterium]|nr:hydratase [Lachnospiraceae bacterium]